jgi:uncharacterized protein YdhG (YjbR/CyaY superfamily)
VEKAKSVEGYLAGFPDEVQTRLRKLQQLVRKAAPDAVESISYGIPAFKLNGKVLVYFAAWKAHISVYPVPKGTAALRKETAPYQTGKGTVSFPNDKPIPYALVKKIVGARMKDVV